MDRDVCGGLQDPYGAGGDFLSHPDKVRFDSRTGLVMGRALHLGCGSVAL